MIEDGAQFGAHRRTTTRLYISYIGLYLGPVGVAKYLDVPNRVPYKEHVPGVFLALLLAFEWAFL